MWIEKYNVIAMFPLDAPHVDRVHRALAWGGPNLIKNPGLVPYEGQLYEIRTYQFNSQGQRGLFKHRIAKVLGTATDAVELEDEAAKLWVPDRP